MPAIIDANTDSHLARISRWSRQQFPSVSRNPGYLHLLKMFDDTEVKRFCDRRYETA